jgi:hypothetical protein
MGSVSDLVAALALLGITRVWNAREEDRKSRQEEAFVPFNLPHYAVGTSDWHKRPQRIACWKVAK